VVQPAHLVAGGRAHPSYEIGVPARGQPDRLGEDGGLAEPGDPVQRLGAGFEGGEAEPVDGRLVLVQQRHLLRQREPAEQVVDPLGERQVRPAERRGRGLGHRFTSGGMGLSKRFDTDGDFMSVVFPGIDEVSTAAASGPSRDRRS
jgi:hypothetical protein